MVNPMSAARFTFAAVLGARVAIAQCTGGDACPPCSRCRVAPATGTNPTVSEMASLFDSIARGPARYGNLGWDFGGSSTFGAGSGWCGGSGPKHTVAVTFPCVLLKAIYVTESNWRQFCSTNQTVISFDCGYGIAQVTSGMRPGEASAYDGARVASSPAYNVSVGAAILAGKWRASPCVGDNDPEIIEDWYFATWGYNGFAFKNNPNNPMYSASRPEFRSPGIASAQTRGNYPYQELVWGYAHHPPSIAHYVGVALAYPRRSEICSNCGLPTTDISEPVGSHRDACGAAPVDAGAAPDAGPATDAGPPVIQADASVRLDAGVLLDAAPSDDTGADSAAGPASDSPRGCSCRVTPRPPSTGAAAGLFAVGWCLRRGRRTRPSGVDSRD